MIRFLQNLANVHVHREGANGAKILKFFLVFFAPSRLNKFCRC